MSCPSRRSLVTSAAVLVGMTLSGVGAQESTPGRTGFPPRQLLAYYIQYVWEEGDDTMIASFFDPVAFDLTELQRQHKIWRDGLDPENPIDLVEVTENEESAMAFGSFNLDDESAQEFFVFIHVNDAGNIDSYRWMSDRLD